MKKLLLIPVLALFVGISSLYAEGSQQYFSSYSFGVNRLYIQNCLQTVHNTTTGAALCTITAVVASDFDISTLSNITLSAYTGFTISVVLPTDRSAALTSTGITFQTKRTSDNVTFDYKLIIRKINKATIPYSLNFGTGYPYNTATPDFMGWVYRVAPTFNYPVLSSTSLSHYLAFNPSLSTDSMVCNYYASNDLNPTTSLSSIIESSSDGITWTTIKSYNNNIPINTATPAQKRVALLLSAGTQYIRFTMTGKGASDPNISINAFNIKHASIINYSTSSLTGLNYFVIGGPSVEQSFTVTGSDLTSNIVITPPENFEISKTLGTGFVTTALNLTQSGGTINTTPVYVRLVPGLASGDYSGNIALTSIGVPTKYIACSGSTNPLILINSGALTTVVLTNPIADVILSGNGTSLTIDADKTVNSLTLEPNTKLDLSTNTLTLTGNLTLKVDKTTSPSVSVTHALSVSGNVSLQKTLDNSKWYFMSFPSDVIINDIAKVSGTETLVLGTNWWIKYYDGAGRVVNLGTSSNWKQMLAGQTLTANQGYIIGLASVLTGDYVLSFPLNKNLVTSAESAKTVSITAYGEGAVAANHVGWNLVGIPYLSKFTGNGVGANYLTFHNGTTYTQSAKADVLSISPFDAFFVQANTVGANTTGTALSFATESRQLVRSSVATDLTERVQLNFTSSTGTDKTNLIMDNNQSDAYEINQDLEKWLTMGTDIPQVYTQLGGMKFAYNALPLNSVQNLPIGFYTKAAGQNTIGVNASQAPGLSTLMLTDNSTGTITDLLTSDYSFTTLAGTDNSRFVITAQRVSTEINVLESGVDVPKITVANGKMILNNIDVNARIRVYDAIGRLEFNKVANTNSLEMTLRSAGLYVVQIESGSKNWTVKIVNKK